MSDDSTETGTNGNDHVDIEPVDNDSSVIFGKSQKTADNHPYSYLFKEGVLDGLDKSQQEWIRAQKDGPGVQKGIEYLFKLRGKKLLEKPGEDASDEEKQAYDNSRRLYNGVPPTAEGYKFENPKYKDEEIPLTDVSRDKLSKFAFEVGMAPEMAEKIPNLMLEMHLARQEQTLVEETAKANEFFGKDRFKKLEPVLQTFIEEHGYDFDSPTFRTADGWRLAYELMETQTKLKEFTKEDTTVQPRNGVPSDYNMANIESQLEAITKDPAFMNRSDSRWRKVNDQYLELMKRKSAARAYQRTSNIP